MKFVYCALCGKPVDEQTMTHDPARKGWRVEVSCHGQTDECFLSEAFVQRHGDVISEGEATAFATKALPQPEAH